jgi:uncharacterized delta-60 repeat protein
MNRSSTLRRIRTACEPLEPRQFLSATALDTSFNSTGKVYTSAGSFFSAAVTQPDGKVLAVGLSPAGASVQDFVVVRYNANGTVDTSFGGGTGRIHTDFSGRVDEARAVALLEGGKFLVAGTSTSSNKGDFAIARYNSNGTLDTSFGTSGKARIDFGSHNDQFGAMSVLSSGKIMLVGTISQSNGDDIGLARLNANGTIDTTFGGGTGRKTTDFGTFNNAGDSFEVVGRARAITVLPSGEFLVGGQMVTAEIGGPFASFAGLVALYKADGTLDTQNFGQGDGFVQNNFLTDVASIAELANGKILIAGTDDISDDFHIHSSFAVARQNADGSPDFSFGTSNGNTIVTMRTSTDPQALITNRLGGMIVQADGKILVAGQVEDGGDTGGGGNPGGNFLGLLRLTSSGKLDTSYSGDGKFLTTAMEQGGFIARALGGKNIVVGQHGNQAAILRYSTDSAATASIAGRFWNDSNGDGVKQSTEGVLVGWRAFVDSNNNGFYDVGEISAVSNSSGFYSLTGLAPGTYRIREVRQDGWTRTKPAGVYPLGYYDVTLAVGQAVSGKDFGNKH